jgi:hypothetical protein
VEEPAGELPAATRRLVRERAANRCEYCQLTEFVFHPDHIVPRSRWPSGPGLHDPANLAWACLHCNSIKQDHTTGLDPLTGLEERLFNPRTDAWSEHFAWTGGFTEIVGTTAIGRATVWRLKLNRPVYKRHRRLLLAAARGGFRAWP